MSLQILMKNIFNIFKLLSGQNCLVNEIEHITSNLSFPYFIFCLVSVINLDKVVRIKLLTDVANIVLQKPYHPGLNKIKLVYYQHLLSIKTLNKHF